MAYQTNLAQCCEGVDDNRWRDEDGELIECDEMAMENEDYLVCRAEEIDWAENCGSDCEEEQGEDFEDSMDVQLWADTGDCPLGDQLYDYRSFDTHGILLDCENDLEGDEREECIRTR